MSSIAKKAVSTATKGQGIISVSAGVWDSLGKPETPEEWHKALLLPDAYEVERIDKPLGRVASLVQQDYYSLYVNHEAIPVTVGAGYLPVVTPFYYVDYHEGQRSRPYITRIEITNLVDGVWQKIAVTDENDGSSHE